MKSKKKKELPKGFIPFKKKGKAGKDKKDKKNIKEAVTNLINNLMAGKPTAAKSDLKGVIDEKIKQKIINNNNTKLF